MRQETIQTGDACVSKDSNLHKTTAKKSQKKNSEKIDKRLFKQAMQVFQRIGFCNNFFLNNSKKSHTKLRINASGDCSNRCCKCFKGLDFAFKQQQAKLTKNKCDERLFNQVMQMFQTIRFCIETTTKKITKNLEKL